MAGQSPRLPATNQAVTMWRGLWGPSGLSKLLWEHGSGCSHLASYGMALAKHSTEIPLYSDPNLLPIIFHHFTHCPLALGSPW